MAKIRTIKDVVEYQLCSGCGVCAFLQPERFHMTDMVAWGRRPVVVNSEVPENPECLQACPGTGLVHGLQPAGIELGMWANWGPVYGVWEGHSGDGELRKAGSSGGAASALALYCIERDGAQGVLHTAASPESPYLNKTVVSRTRGELLARTGSRYSPASPCEGLSAVAAEPGKWVFVGKPCDVAGVRNARKFRSEVDARLFATIAVFCAGTPSTRGTLDLLAKTGVTKPETVAELRYRGDGWPGTWAVETRDEKAEVHELSYSESWGFLQKYRQWRCYVCPDHTGEFSDIAVGDPWYRQVHDGEHGSSLIVARTRRGVELLKAAVEAGYIVITAEDRSLLPLSQPNLMATRTALWGRLAVLGIMGAAVPKYSGFPLFALWCRLPFKEKLRSLSGTAARVIGKGLRRRARVTTSAQSDSASDDV